MPEAAVRGKNREGAQKLESLLQREPVIVYRVMRAIFRVVHLFVNRMATQTSELTNYIYKVHGKY